MKKNTYYSIAAVILLVIAVLILFNGNCNKTTKPVIISTKDQVKPLEKSEALRIPVIADSLRIIKSRDSAILVLRQLLYSSQSDVRRYIKITTDLKNTGSVSPVNSGSVSAEDYYTREQAIKDQQISSQLANDLCNETISKLDAQVNTQHEIISVKDSMYIELRKAFNTSIDQQNLYNRYTKKLEKKARWNRAGKFMWKGIAIGSVAYILISSVKP